MKTDNTRKPVLSGIRNYIEHRRGKYRNTHVLVTVDCHTDTSSSQHHDRVIYVMHWSHETRRTIASMDSRFFAAMRKQYRDRSLPATNPSARRCSYVLPITNRCNFECPLCYASAKTSNHLDMPLSHIRRLALQVKADGGQCLSLSGGEPTLHAKIHEVIRMIRSEIGLLPVIVTNGLRIAEDPGFALSLKEAGLSRVSLQLDTLQDEAYQYLRGRKNVAEKTIAIDNVVSAGLRLTLIATVCGRSLNELGEVLDFAIARGPVVRQLRFQTAVPVGRVPPDLTCVTREDILQALTRSCTRCKLHPSDFTSFLCGRSGQSGPHPDCAVHACLRVAQGTGVPLEKRATGVRSQKPKPAFVNTAKFEASVPEHTIFSS